jgi:hypothetical protein
MKKKGIRFEIFTAVTMKNTILWNMALVRADVSEEHIDLIIMVKRIREIGIK